MKETQHGRNEDTSIERVGGLLRSPPILLLGGAVVAAAVAVGTYLVVCRPWQSDDPAGAGIGKVDAGDDQGDQLPKDLVHPLRYDVRELKQQAELLREDIKALQSEIDNYQRQFRELATSEQGKHLVKDEWAAGYFVDRWGARLPHENVAKHLRGELEALIGGLDKRQANREVPYGVFMEERKRMELIAFEATEARREYAWHCRLLEALAKVADAEHPGSSLGLPDSLPAELREFAAELQGDRSAELPGDGESGKGSQGGESSNLLRELRDLRPRAAEDTPSVGDPVGDGNQRPPQ